MTILSLSRSRKKAPQHSFDRHYEATRPQRGETLYQWATTDYFKMNSLNEINRKTKSDHQLLVPPIIERFMDTAAVADFDCMRCLDINKTRLKGEPRIPCLVSGVDDRCALCIVTKQRKSSCRSQLPRNYLFEEPFNGQNGYERRRDSFAHSTTTSLSSRLLSPDSSKRTSDSSEERDSKRSRYNDLSLSSFDRSSMDGTNKKSERASSADNKTTRTVEDGENGAKAQLHGMLLGPKGYTSNHHHQDGSSPILDTNGSSKDTSNAPFFPQTAIDAMGPYGSFFEKINKDFKVKERKISELEESLKEEKQKAREFEQKLNEEEKKTEELRKVQEELQTKLSIEQDIFRHIGGGKESAESEQMKVENQQLRARIILLEDNIKHLFTTTMASADEVES